MIGLIILPAFAQQLKKMTIIGKPLKPDGEMVARREINEFGSMNGGWLKRLYNDTNNNA